MLKRLDEQYFDQYIEFAYELALDTTKSGYPTYTDGIKTKTDFIERSRRAFSEDTEEILLFEQDESVTGWIHYRYLPEDQYVDTCAFCVSGSIKEALAEFIAFAEDHFPGSELYLGFPGENTEAVAALQDNGYECIEKSYNDVIAFSDYALRPENEGITPISRENYELFSKLHSQADQDMYWNSSRILNALENWKIFVYRRNGKTAGAIYFMDDKFMPEIFGIDFPEDIYDSGAYRALLTAALNDAKRSGAAHMVFFQESEAQLDALACGFRCVGEYVCFKVLL